MTASRRYLLVLVGTFLWPLVADAQPRWSDPVVNTGEAYVGRRQPPENHQSSPSDLPPRKQNVS